PNWTNKNNHEYGDKFPYKTTTPSNPPVPGDYAKTVQDYVNFLVANPSMTSPAIFGASITNNNSFYNDPPTYSVPNAGLWWATNGYNGVNRLPGATAGFYGYTMGPGYYGKTFFMWPPDALTPSDNGVVAPPAANESTKTAVA